MRFFRTKRHGHSWDKAPQWALDIAAMSLFLIKRIDDMAKTLQELIDQGNATLAQVTTNTDLDNSIIAIVNAQAATLTDLRAQLAAAGTDAAKLAELGDVMDALATKATAEGAVTADAIKANTPAAAPTADPAAQPAA
jgi:hypothetical protein